MQAQSTVTADELVHPFEIRKLDKQRVEIYAETPDELPPILVYRVKGVGLVLADGWHRVNAWAKNGRHAYPATIKSGTLVQAETAAGRANLHHGRPLSWDERKAWAQRMVKAHGSMRKAADAIGVAHSTVQTWVAHDHVQSRSKARVAGGERMARAGHLAEAPEEFKNQLTQAAKDRNWTGGEIETAIEAVQDRRIPAKTRKAILAGEADPIKLNDDGEPTYHKDTLGRSIRDAQKSASAVLWYAALEADNNLMDRVSVDELVGILRSDFSRRGEAQGKWTLDRRHKYIVYLNAVIDRLVSSPGLRVIA